MAGKPLFLPSPQVWADPRYARLVADIERRLRLAELRLDLVRPDKPRGQRQVA